jgi:hypothetical protein
MILRNVKDTYSMKEIFVGNIHKLFRQVSPALLLGVPACYFQRALVSESEMVITQLGTHNTSEMI